MKDYTFNKFLINELGYNPKKVDTFVQNLKDKEFKIAINMVRSSEPEVTIWCKEKDLKVLNYVKKNVSGYTKSHLAWMNDKGGYILNVRFEDII